MIQGLIAAVSNSLTIVSERYFLANKGFKVKEFTSDSFLVLALFVLILSPLFFVFSEAYFEIQNIALLAALVIMAAAVNYLLFTGISKTEVEEAELLILSTWVFTIILGGIFFAAERNPIRLALGLVSGLAILGSHLSHHHLNLDIYGKMLLLASILMAGEEIIAKQLLSVYDPFSLYAIRIILCTVIFISLFGINFHKVHGKKVMVFFAAIHVFPMIEFIFRYWSYQINGVVLTSMLMLLAPLFAAWFGHTLLKEKIHFKKILATAIAIVCLGLALVV
ncbi:MAG: DMT family transporter [Candidatus Diapherotrites archaeon]